MKDVTDDQSALILALDAARGLESNARSPLQTARVMTGIIDTQRHWWDDMGGVDGPLAIFYAADAVGMDLFWLGADVERWHPAVRARKREETQQAEEKWRKPVEVACAALTRYLDRGLS